MATSQYKGVYPEIANSKTTITSELHIEEEKFRKTLVAGLKQFEKMQKMLRRFGGKKQAKQMRQLEQIKDKLPPELLAQLPGRFK